MRKLLLLVAVLLAMLGVRANDCLVYGQCSFETDNGVRITWGLSSQLLQVKIQTIKHGVLYFALEQEEKQNQVWEVSSFKNSEPQVRECELVGAILQRCGDVGSNVNLRFSHKVDTNTKGFILEFEQPQTTVGDQGKSAQTSTKTLIVSYTDRSHQKLYSETQRLKLRLYRLDLQSNYNAVSSASTVETWTHIRSLSETESETTEEGSWYGGRFMLHEHYLLLLWTIVVDILTIIGKYAKFFTRYFEIHTWMLFFLGIASFVIAKNGSDEVKSGGGGDDHRLLVGEFASNERLLLAESLAKSKFHTTTGEATNLLTLTLLVQGIVLRFAIALGTKLTIFVYFHVTYQRWIHTILGILIWIVSRVCLFTGVAIHEKRYGPTLFIYTVVETIIAILAYLVLEILYRISRINNRTALAEKEGKVTEENTKILEMIRAKSIS